MSDDWLTTARPLFTTLGPSVPWTRETIERRVAQAAEDGCDTVMAFVADEGYALWPSRFVPIAPRTEGRDLVAAWCEASHAAGLRFVAQWMGVHVQTVTGARHPGWFQRDVQGTASSVLCVNTPFGAYLDGQIREVAERYSVDGVYLDGLYARHGGCYCDACRAAFESRYDRPLRLAPPAAGPEGEAGHWLDRWQAPEVEDPDLAAFRFDTVTRFLERLAAGLARVRPGTALILDTLGPQAGHWPNGHDLRRLRDSVDVLALECYPDQVREPLWHAALESEAVRAEGGLPIWSLRWISRDPDGDLVSVPPATLETHVATAIVHATAPTIVEMNLYAVDESLRPTVRRTLADAGRATAWRDGLPATRWAGVLAHRASQIAAARRGTSRSAFDAVAGGWLALTEAHLPVELVTDERLADGSALDGLAVLLVPDVRHLADAEAEAIAEAVRSGLGLVVTAHALLGPLGERLGIATAGTGHRAGRIGPESAGGSELVNYVRLPDHAVSGADAGRLWSYPGTYVRITGGPGEQLGSILDADHAAMDGERWFGWLPGEAAWPLGLALPLGSGRVVAWAAPLETVFHRQGRPEAATLLTGSARWAAGAGPAVEVDAPLTVEARTWLGDGSAVLAFANRSVNDLYAIGAGVALGAATSSMAGAGTGERTTRAQLPRAVVPVGAVTVSLDWPGAIPGVETLSGHAPRLEQDGGRLHLTLDRLGAYDAVRLMR